MVYWCVEGGGEVSGREGRESYARGAKGISKMIMKNLNVSFEFGTSLSASKDK
jgi:hypothetical protein